MTMQAMVEQLEDAGFKVDKVYEKLSKSYRFTISKGGHYTSLMFMYPKVGDKAFCDQKQREFIEFIIDQWRRDHNKVWITTAGTDTSEFYERFLNSIYGAFPGDHPPFVALDTDTAPKVEFIKGRGSGKTQACIDYMKKLIEKGLISMDAANAYIRNDVMTAKQLNEIMIQCGYRAPWTSNMPEIKNVHFSGPVTAVIWMDGTKTIVRCQGDNVQDPEKGLAMAIAKKALGTNKSGSNYYDIFKQFLPKEEQDG